VGFLLYEWRRPVALGLVVAVGMFSKETAAVALGMVLLHDWYRKRRPYVAGVVAIALPVAASFAIKAWLGLKMSNAFVDNPEVGASFLVARLTAVKVLAKMIGLWFWPAKLSADYSYSQIGLFAGEWWAVALIAVALIAVCRRTEYGFWGLLFFGAILPTSNLVTQIGSIMAERFLYLPGFALAAIVVWFLMSLDRRAAPALLSLAFVACGVRTIARNNDWSDDLRFWRVTAEASPNSFKARSQYGMELYARGHLQAAMAENERSLEMLRPLPPSRDAILPWAQAHQYYTATGEVEKAAQAAMRAADIMNASAKE
jgi:hypothetical protein